MRTLLVAALAALGFAASASTGAVLPDKATLDVAFKPIRPAGGDVTGVEVTEVIASAGDNSVPALKLEAAVTYAAVLHVADRIQNLEVHDTNGVVPLSVQEDPPAAGGYPFFRHWTATRPVSYPVTIRYRADVQPTGGPNGPAFGIRPSGGGISGSGYGFMLLPENAGTTLSRVHWDLSELAPGAVAASTWGAGDYEVAGGPEKIGEEWMLAGPAHAYSPGGGFSAYWLGEPPFDARADMDWAAQAYGYLGESFGYLNPPPSYRVFMRVLDTPPYGGGTALGPSFMLSMGQKATTANEAARRGTIFHEMTHQWVGSIEGEPGQIAWYAEGLTVYYSTVLPLRGSLETIDEYAAQLNHQAKSYYDSKARNWSADKIASFGFNDEAVRGTPYVRGAMYFAALDAEIRIHSRGKRSLDTFLHPMFISREKGAHFNTSVWESMLRRELGPKAVEEFRRELIGGTDTVVPASDAFGPCFRRVPYKIADGATGYQWARIASVPDSRCRSW